MEDGSVYEGHNFGADVQGYGGTVNAVVNTTTGGRIPMRDGFAIRRAAAERCIPCFTFLDTARVTVEALTYVNQLTNIQTIHEYLSKHAG